MDRESRVENRARAKEEQESAVTWSQYFVENRDWLTRQIDALEDMDRIKGEKRPTLDLTWVLSLYHLARDYLDTFNESHTMLHEMKTSVEPLEKRVRFLEAGSSEATKLPKIPIDWDALANMSNQVRNSESATFRAKGRHSKSRNEGTNKNISQSKRMPRSL
jgi:hypothetical protein